MKSYSLIITGKVQGVWYRASTKDKALELGLTGRVWNEPDGSVGALVQGPEETVATLIDWCKQGPPLARVEQVMVEKEDYDTVFSTFEITNRRN